MKNNKHLSLILGFLLLTQNVFSQNDSIPRHRNEFGIDATGFIRSFVKTPTAFDYTYTPTYYLTYRRYFKTGNIRFGIGGVASNQEVTDQLVDSTTFNNNYSAMDSRLGWEFKTELSKRWQVYYGLDFKFSLGNTKYEDVFSNVNGILGRESHFVTYGLAPVLGFRFKLNDRISLLTEANFSFNMTKSFNNREFYTPYPGYPKAPDKATPDTKGIYTSFSQPLAVYFVFNI